MKRPILSRDQALILHEAQSRLSVEQALLNSCFDKQLDFIHDPARLKAAQCTRRAGKTYGGAGVYLSYEALKHPRSTLLYIATTRESAKRILFKDILFEINRNFKIGMKFNHTNIFVTFPNESVLYLLGLDSKKEEMDKALGQKYRLVVIDEGGSWKQDQRDLIHSVLEPACADYEGTICLLGSPVNNTKTYFHDITARGFLDPKAEKGWSVHKWGWWDNPHTRDAVGRQIERMKEKNPLVVETPFYRQMYMNEWVTDPGALVYKFNEDRNLADELPRDHAWFYALGVDLGYEDETAFTVEAYSDTHPDLFIVESSKAKHLDITAVGERLAQFRHRYPIHKWVVDGASKQAVEELRKRHGFPLIAADKHGKADMIEIMNADFTTGRIKLLRGKCDALEEEYENLIWDPRSNKREEHSACANHCADSALYPWRMCYHYLARPAAPKVRPGSEEAMDQWWDAEAARAKKTKTEDFVKKDFGKDYGY